MEGMERERESLFATEHFVRLQAGSCGEDDEKFSASSRAPPLPRLPGALLQRKTAYTGHTGNYTHTGWLTIQTADSRLLI